MATVSSVLAQIKAEIKGSFEPTLAPHIALAVLQEAVRRNPNQLFVDFLRELSR